MRSGTIIERRLYPSPNPHIRIEEVTYQSGPYRVKGLLAIPKRKGRYSSIIYFRGGIQSLGTVRPARIAQYASYGFIVFAPFYRGNRGGEGRDEFVGDDRLDAISAVDVLKQIEWTNEHIHIVGYSRGGAMACWTAIAREEVTTATIWAGMSDIVATYFERIDMRRMMKRLIGKSPNTNPSGYRERDPLSQLYRARCPFLIVHGKRDQNVSIAQSYRLEALLRAERKEVATIYFETYDHFLPNVIGRMLIRHMTAWMKSEENRLSR